MREQIPTDALENAPWRSGSGSTFTHELANKRPNVAVLCRLEDAALKFRGCFQAICELRSQHRQRERGSPRGWCMADRAWSSLNLPIQPSDRRSCLSFSSSLTVYDPLRSFSHHFSAFHSLSPFEVPLTFSPTFTASLRFAPWLGHPLFALHTRHRNEQLPS